MKTGVLVQSEEMGRLCDEIVQELDVEVRWMVAEQNDPFSYVERLIREHNIDAVIARHPTGYLLEETLPIPVVILHITRFDLIRAAESVDPGKHSAFMYMPQDSEKYNYYSGEFRRHAIDLLPGTEDSFLILRENQVIMACENLCAIAGMPQDRVLFRSKFRPCASGGRTCFHWFYTHCSGTCRTRLRIKRWHFSSPPSHIHANPSKNLTYANMERYINVYANAAELLEMLERVKELGAAQTNSVQFVKRWFISQFPNYKKLPDFTSSKLIVEVIPAPLINEDKAA